MNKGKWNRGSNIDTTRANRIQAGGCVKPRFRGFHFTNTTLAIEPKHFDTLYPTNTNTPSSALYRRDSNTSSIRFQVEKVRKCQPPMETRQSYESYSGRIYGQGLDQDTTEIAIPGRREISGRG
jgi:hypothetical protein